MKIENIKKLLRNSSRGKVVIDLIGRLLKTIRAMRFNSTSYWDDRYKNGGNSGVGSYGKFAIFKAEFINDFVKKNNIEAVAEFGCGDGAQLELARYPYYIGLDVSPVAIKLCRDRFEVDAQKSFFLVNEWSDKVDLTLSLDVIYHLVEDTIFSEYMNSLFSASRRFVVIYSSNFDEYDFSKNPHVRHRKFTAWIERNFPEWRLTSHVKNIYPYDGNYQETSFSDFFIYSLPPKR